VLLETIAHQAGAAAHAVKLTADLQRSRQQLVTTREEERRRLRRDLHDGLGPHLASQTLTIEAIDKLLDRDPATARDLLGHLKTQAQTAIADIRRLVYELRPPALDELGLEGALGESARQYRSAGWQVSIQAIPSPLPPLPAAVEIAVYRIVREAITNAIHHAQTCCCTVKIEAGAGQMRLTITDDGPGFSPEFRTGVGLNSMRERAEELGGQLALDNQAQGGARVRVWLPLPEEV
jgi:signal transduction histidine kinase